MGRGAFLLLFLGGKKSQQIWATKQIASVVWRIGLSALGIFSLFIIRSLKQKQAFVFEI